MATKILTQPFLWKRFTSNALDTYLGLPGEPVIDLRTGVPQLRLCDGVTPGGHPVGGSNDLSGVAIPFIISPLDGATGVAKSPIITASQFHGIKLDGTADTHVASYWQFAADQAFTSIAYQSGRTTTDLTSIDLQAKGVQLDSGRKYARVAYEGGEGGVSDWSPVIGFDVLAIGPGATIDGDIVVGQLNGFWILAAPATKRAIRRHGLYGTDTTLPNITSAATPDPNSGTYNTNVLTSATYANVNDGYVTGAAAAKYCRFELDKAYDLPNKEELNFLYQNRAAIDAADTSGGAVTLAKIGAGTAPGNATPWIWSSTETSSYHSWYQRFSDGYQHYTNKDGELWVVPVRRISV